MGKQDVIIGFQGRYSQAIQNLKTWSFFEWFFFFILIPLTICLIFLLPQSIKDAYLIFDTTQLMKIQTYLLNEYTHSTFDHLVGNLKTYLIAIFVIFALEDNKRRFKIMSFSAFILVPILASLLTVAFWNIINRDTVSQGFSGITAAFFAYALTIFLVWLLHDFLPAFQHPEKMTGRNKIVYYLLCGLVGCAFIMISTMGLQWGSFIQGETGVSNGIAHFGGFVTGLIVFLLCDLTSDDRNLNFNTIFGMAIFVSILLYIPYLQKVIDVATIPK